VKPSFFRIYIVIAVSNLASTVYYLAIDSFSARSGFGRSFLLPGVQFSGSVQSEFPQPPSSIPARGDMVA
jgi:hypothetical protein